MEQTMSAIDANGNPVKKVVKKKLSCWDCVYCFKKVNKSEQFAVFRGDTYHYSCYIEKLRDIKDAESLL